jgi:adenylate cyclase
MSEQTGKRRMAAVLAADVAGYSRLMGEDEEATIAALGRARAVFREHVSGHDGRVVDTAGDSVLSIFESVIEAVRAALAVQETLAARNADVPEDRRMQFRIGVHFGDIVEQDDGTIYGDGVNIAARLESLAEPGGLTVSGTVHEHIEGKLGIGLADLGEQEVKNIARPVRAWRVAAGGAPAPAAPPKAKSRLSLALAAALVVVVVAGLAAWQTGLLGTPDQTIDPILAMPSGPSIAVLPFDDRGEGDGPDHFADGLVEDIITALSRFSNLMVFGRNSTIQYKDAEVAAQTVRQDLGADYILEGSVRGGVDRLRVTVQLTDAETGAQIWAESYDRELTGASVFDLQDEITSTIVATLADTYGEISRATFNKAQRKAPKDLQSYECVAAAQAYYRTAISPAMHLQVRDCLEGAVEKDPDYADAWAWLAAMYRDEAQYGFNARPQASDRAFEAARKAIAIDPESQEAYIVLAHMHFYRNDIDTFLLEAEKTLEINPNSPDGLAAIGTYIGHIGQWGRGAALVRKATMLDPKFPGWFHFVFGHEHFTRGEYDAALSEYLQIHLPDYFWAQVFLVTSYGHLGRGEDAERALKHLLELYPNFGEQVWAEFAKWNWRDQDVVRVVEGLRKAGLDIPDVTH